MNNNIQQLLFNQLDYLPINYVNKIKEKELAPEMKLLFSRAECEFDMAILSNMRYSGTTLRSLDQILINKIQSEKASYILRIALLYKRRKNTGLSHRAALKDMDQLDLLKFEAETSIKIIDSVLNLFKQHAFFNNPDSGQYSVNESAELMSSEIENQFFVKRFKHCQEVKDPIAEFKNGILDDVAVLEEEIKKITAVYTKCLQNGEKHQDAFHRAMRTVCHSLASRADESDHYPSLFKSSFHLMTHRVEREEQKALAAFEKEQKRISTILKLAECDGILPSTIANDFKLDRLEGFEFLLESMDNLAKQVYADFHRKRLEKAEINQQKVLQTKLGSQKMSGKKKKQAKKGVLHAKASLPVTPSAPVIQKLSLPNGSKNAFGTDFILSIQRSHSCFTVDARVTRWLKASTEEIKQFINIEGKLTYAEESDAEIEKQKLYHSLPNVGKLLADKHRRAIYSFPTDTGLGMTVILVADGEVKTGVLYLGIDKGIGNDEDMRGHLYHFHLVEKEFSNVFTASGLEFLQQKAEEDEKDSEDQGHYILNAELDYDMSESGVITVTDPKRPNLKLTILPVRPDLFAEMKEKPRAAI